MKQLAAVAPPHGLEPRARRQRQQGADPGGMPPAEMEKLVKSEIAKWAKVVKDAGAKVDN